MTCRLCLTPVTEDSDTSSSYAESLRTLILKTFPQLHVDSDDRPAMCERCVGALLRCNGFRRDCVQAENKVALYRSLNGLGRRPVDLRHVLRFHGDLQPDPPEAAHVCRLCLKQAAPRGAAHLEPGSGHVDALARCLPEVDVQASSKPVMCASCAGSLAHMSDFLETCLRVQRIAQRLVKCESLELEDLACMPMKMEDGDVCTQGLIVKTEPEEDTWQPVNDCEVKDEPIELKVFAEGAVAEGNQKEKKKRKGKARGKTSGSDKGEYSCSKCEKQYKSKTSYMYHIKRTHDENLELSMYKCDLCAFSTAIKGNLRRHLFTKHHPTEKIYRCSECSYTTNMPSYLSDHTRYVHRVSPEGRPTEVLACPRCPYVTPKRSNLSRHLLCRHQVPDAVTGAAAGDGGAAARQQLLARHYTLLRCPYCSCQTYYRSYLNKHMRQKHGEGAVDADDDDDDDEARPVVHRCSLCRYEAHDKSYLVRHVLKAHGRGRRVSACPRCPFSSASRLALRYHLLRRHPDGRRSVMLCTRCDFATVSANSLAQHVRRHDPRRGQEEGEEAAAEGQGTPGSWGWYQPGQFQCAQCNFCTVRKGSLVTHIKLLHPRKQEMELYSCDRCPFTTFRKSYHTRHQLLCGVTAPDA